MKLLAFLVVGGLNTLLGIAAYGGLLKCGVPFPLASGLSLALGIAVGFHAHRHLVFRRKGLFGRYVAVWIAIYALANLLIWLLQRWIGPFLAGVAAMPLNAGAAFMALRHFVFRDPISGVPAAEDPADGHTRTPPGPRST